MRDIQRRIIGHSLFYLLCFLDSPQVYNGQNSTTITFHNYHPIPLYLKANESLNDLGQVPKRSVQISG